MNNFLSTQEAARIAGVGLSTIKRWADQGLLETARTPGGHRRFHRRSLQQLLRSYAGGERDIDSTIATWIRVMIDGQKNEIDAQLLSARERLGTWYLVADELGVALGELGAHWACGEISVADEHMASHNLARALARASDAMPGPGTAWAPRCVLACAEGEEHMLGLSLAELCLRELGWRAVWLGNRTPTDEVIRLVESNRVEMVALSASETIKDKLALATIASAVETACTEHSVGLVLGGSGPWPETISCGVRVRSFNDFSRYLAKTTTSRTPHRKPQSSF